MAEYDRERTLSDLEAALAVAPPDRLIPMPGDKWLLSSCWQKAVRRGDVNTALRAASALWRQDTPLTKIGMKAVSLNSIFHVTKARPIRRVFYIR